jgi:hypothetical protein
MKRDAVVALTVREESRTSDARWMFTARQAFTWRCREARIEARVQ